MTQTNDKATKGLLSGAFGVAKKLSQALPGTAVKASEHQQLSQLSQHILGGRLALVQKTAHAIAPTWSDKVSDYVFDQLNHFSSNISSVDAILDEAGVRDLEELTQDVDRSKRISQALAEQNKWIASIQGAFTGATGLVGATVDVPASIVMSLRMIYQVGRAYGFELDKEAEQDIVQFIFKQINLGLIAEKQTLILALKTLSGLLKEQNPEQLKSFMAQHQDLATLRTWLINDQGELKMPWLQQASKWSLLSKVTPVASASVSAVYSWRLLEDVYHKAQEIFSLARQYLQQHQDVQLSAIAAYEKAIELLSQSVPKLLENLPEAAKVPDEADIQYDQPIEMPEHDTISQVKVLKKSETVSDPDEAEPAKSLSDLAEQMVEDTPVVEKQQPALSDKAETDFPEVETLSEKKS